jgi:hypothetical protein
MDAKLICQTAGVALTCINRCFSLCSN